MAMKRNALGMTVAFALLGSELSVIERTAIALFSLSTSIAILLGFMAQGYMASVSHRFISIDAAHMEAIAKTAKRFYVPFLLSMIADVCLVILGALTLIFHLQIG